MRYLKRKTKKSIMLFCIGLILIIIGLSLLIDYQLSIKILDEKENEKIENYFATESTVDTHVEESIEDEDSPQSSVSTTNDYNYIAVLEIPSISLKRGLVSQDSYYNNINYNIQIIEHSTMPNVENGNLILASHNGASYIGFFKNLNKLKQNDKVYVYYNGFKYEYTIDTNYETPKDGRIEIYRNQDKTTITLITCKKNNRKTQIVYIGYLTNKEPL